MYLENPWKGLHMFGKITLSRSWNGIQCACTSADCVPLICTIFFRSSESDIAEFMLVEVPNERVTIMEELGRGAFGIVYKSVMKGLPEKNTSSKPKDHRLDSHEGRIVATKVLPGAWIQNIWQKHNLLFQQTLFTRVILIDNRQERLSCNRFELFNPIDSKHYTYRGKQHLNAPVGNSGRFPFSQNFRNFRFGGKWNTFRRLVPLENSQKKWKI